MRDVTRTELHPLNLNWVPSRITPRHTIPGNVPFLHCIRWSNCVPGIRGTAKLWCLVMLFVFAGQSGSSNFVSVARFSSNPYCDQRPQRPGYLRLHLIGMALLSSNFFDGIRACIFFAKKKLPLNSIKERRCNRQGNLCRGLRYLWLVYLACRRAGCKIILGHKRRVLRRRSHC